MHQKFRLLASICLVALPLSLPAPLLAQPTPPASPPPAATAATGWGVDLSARDLAVKPGDDFDLYANGGWKKTHTIPADRPSTGTFYDLTEAVQAQVRDIITAAPKDGQIGALYASFMDEARLETLGITPLKADLAQVRALPDKSAFARFMGLTQGRFGITLVGGSVGPDTANADLNVLYLDQSGLGLPDRDYYLNDQFKPQREAYRAYVQRVLTAIGEPDPAAAAATIMAFETEIAKVHWDQAAERDVPRTNNPMSSAQLAAYAPGLDWKAWFGGIGVGPQQRMIVGPNTAIKALARLYADTPLTTLKLWQAFHVADQASPYLNKAMVDSRFDYAKTLAGVTQIRPRWKRGIDLVNGSLGELVGQVYVTRHFTPEAKAKMEVLVANLKTAMAHRIETNGWMSPPTKQAALTKLSKMDVMVGYPDVWRSYAGLTVKADDLYGNVERASAFNQAYAMEDLGKKVNRKKWGMTPQTVNAYNGGGENKIVFPAGILQPPFFNPKADDSVNYGSIGAIIGHEISHGFDDQGRRIDDTGAVRDWWSAEDARRFEAEAKVFGEEYGRFEAAPGAFLKPDVTMGENIADFAGVQVALDAYHTALGGKPAPLLDGLTGDQRFFLAYAQNWRALQREDALRNQVAVDPHSPARFRILGPLPNVDGWYKAWDVKPGDKMYIAPEKRAKIW